MRKTSRLIGVDANVRSVEDAQYTRRLRTRDFDVTYNAWGQGLSPGNEQLEYWGSESADRESSRNYAGIKDAGIDALIRMVIKATDREDLIAGNPRIGPGFCSRVTT